MIQEPVRANVRDLFLVLFVFVAAIVFCGGALANADPLWFLASFDETPARIIIYSRGCRAEYRLGEPGFDQLTAAINQSLSQIDGYENGFGLSRETYTDYREKGIALEVFYLQRVKIHVPYRFGGPDSIFIPLDGSFGESRSIFGGVSGDYLAGALRLKSNAAIRRAAEAVGCAR